MWLPNTGMIKCGDNDNLSVKLNRLIWLSAKCYIIASDFPGSKFIYLTATKRMHLIKREWREYSIKKLKTVL